MFKFIKKLFKKKEPEEDPNIIIEEEEKAKQEIIYTIDKHREERIRLNYRTIMLTGKTIEQLIEPLTNIKIDYTKVHIDYIPIKHKETGFVISHKDLKEKYDEVKEELECNEVVSFRRYNLNTDKPDRFAYGLHEIPFSDDFEILVNDENLEAIDYIRLMNILESSIITDHDLIKKIRPIIQKKINIEKILNKF